MHFPPNTTCWVFAERFSSPTLISSGKYLKSRSYFQLFNNIIMCSSRFPSLLFCTQWRHLWNLTRTRDLFCFTRNPNRNCLKSSLSLFCKYSDAARRKNLSHHSYTIERALNIRVWFIFSDDSRLKIEIQDWGKMWEILDWEN
jgi:hypothetical protein